MKKIVSIPIYVLAFSVLLFSDVHAYTFSADYYKSDSWKPGYATNNMMLAGIMCHPQAQISLDSAKVKIKPEMLLTVKPANPSNFSVLIQGTKTDTVTCNDIGYNLKVHVFEKGTNNSCWSYVTVEDKIAPFVICRDTTVLCMGMESDLDSIPNITLIWDNCTSLSDIRISKMDRIVTRDCADDTFSVVTRTWSAIDPWGRTGTCTQTIKLLRADQSDILFPNDTTIYCPATKISPEWLGQPTIGDKPLDKFCGWSVEFEDITYTKCGESKKILRVWKILDCCALKDTTVTQFIHIADTAPPVIVCPAPYNVFTDDYQCAATFKLKRLFSANDLCNGNNFDVWIKIDNVLLYSPGSIVELTPGIHDLVYRVSDACGNKSTCSTKVEIKDNDAPVLVCPDSLIISLPASNILIEPHYFSSIEYFDNCEIKNVEFKKSVDNCQDGIDDTIFNDTIHVCCDEINEIFDIIFKVTDTSNNMSTCTVRAYIVDKATPVLNSEQNDTVKCGMPRPDWKDPSLGLLDNCLDFVKVTIDTIVNDLNDCGLGTIKRRIIATDPGGNADTVCQSITVNSGDGMDNTAFCALIIWPKDTTLTNCTINQHPDSLKLRPEFIPDPTKCTKAIFTYRDTFVASQIIGVCLNTTWRIWSAWDECSMILMCKDTQYINGLDIAVIRGKLETFNGFSIPNALVIASGQSNVRNTSNVNGEYQLSGVHQGIYRLAPYKNDDHLSGLSTFDLLLIQKHITGTEPFKSIDQFIAADINNDGEITSLDLIELKKIILGVQPVFSQNTSWRFFNSSLSARVQDAYALRRFENPFIETFNGQMSEQNFNGVKIGDVNRNALAGLKNLEMRSDSKLEFEMVNEICKEKELVEITIKANMMQTEGIQGELILADADLVKIGPNALLNETNFHTPAADKRKLRFSWINLSGKTGSSNNLIQLVIRPLRKGYVSEFIKLSANGLTNEAYTSNTETKSLKLKFNHQVSKNKNIDVMSGEGPHPKTVYSGHHQVEPINVFVFPNPVTNEFNIKVDNVKNAHLLNWRIVDETGRILKTGKFNQNARLSMEDMNTGFYLLELQGEDKSFIHRSKIIKK